MISSHNVLSNFFDFCTIFSKNDSVWIFSIILKTTSIFCPNFFPVWFSKLNIPWKFAIFFWFLFRENSSYFPSTVNPFPHCSKFWTVLLQNIALLLHFLLTYWNQTASVASRDFEKSVRKKRLFFVTLKKSDNSHWNWKLSDLAHF